MARKGHITGVGIARHGDTEYQKTTPNGNKIDNLDRLLPVSPNAQSERAKYAV